MLAKLAFLLCRLRRCSVDSGESQMTLCTGVFSKSPGPYINAQGKSNGYQCPEADFLSDAHEKAGIVLPDLLGHQHRLFSDTSCHEVPANPKCSQRVLQSQRHLTDLRLTRPLSDSGVCHKSSAAGDGVMWAHSCC